ncbi:MAG: aminopeptidase P family protein [Lachnospiraceae bacterium]|nr:aminopeptidase P family protein [Lachnospiraceae bacterium]
MGTENKARINRLRNEMKKCGADCCMVFTSDEHCSEYTDPHYRFREYLSGFTGSAGTLIVTADDAGLWTDGRYFLQAENELKGSGIRLFKTGEEGVLSPERYIEEFARKASETGARITIGTDLKLISSLMFRRIDDICVKYGCSVKDIDLASIAWDERPKEMRKPVYGLEISVSGRDINEKMTDLLARLDSLKADAVILSDLSDVMWMFNIRGSDIPYTPVAVSYGLIERDNAYLFIDEGCIGDDLLCELKARGITVKGYDSFDGYVKKITGRSVLYDPNTLNAHVLRLLEGKQLISLRSHEYVPKHIKNKTEQGLFKSCHISDGLAMIRFIYRIKKLAAMPGGPENEYEAAMMLDEIRMNTPGCTGLSFETISAYASNGAVIHYSPDAGSSMELKRKGFLLVDSGGHYMGATTDVTRTIALGPLSDEMKRDYTAVLSGMLDLSDAVFLEGVRGDNLDILARRPIWAIYTDYRHGTGHGVGAGLCVHEGPQAFRYRYGKDNIQPPLEPGMIISDEPGIYLTGKYGIRIENLLLCVGKMTNEWGRFLGFDTLTMVPYEREAIVSELLTKRQRRIINEYHRNIYDLYESLLDTDEREWLLKVTQPI